ncbi:YetF domain-containing protein [uncultured Pontibacter sp.]|uniref:YetF domain-containing protein n=1 Tax=uncultured Pontibacter sp. TaxID=453356 RepID=UPI00260FBB6A|nr:YetF domain-containing protein [uncultured Pontibacter sp.]
MLIFKPTVKGILLGTVRQNIIDNLDEVEAIVLETNGTISVIRKDGDSQGTSTYKQLKK